MARRPQVYLAIGMTGRRWATVLSESLMAVEELSKYNIDGWSPAAHEASETDDESPIIGTNFQRLKKLWKEDCAAIKKSHAILALAGEHPSEGVGFELGMAKYKYKLPIVIVSPKKMRITHLEADAVFPTLKQACKWLAKELK